MVRLILKDGVFVPVDPLPADWHEGHEVQLPEMNSDSPVDPADIDAWLREWEASPGLDAEDSQRVQAALDEQRRLGKEQMRRLMGLG